MAAAPIEGGTTRSPERASSQATHSGHHEPSTIVVVVNQTSGSM
jgi:hypothetical protein